MDRNQLRAFLKVAELRNFTLAADALFYSQPAVTQQIQALEREVGERLFERQGRRVMLTAAGEDREHAGVRGADLDPGRPVGAPASRVASLLP
jgi:DNA-binding transcriptional LysR family regulator